MTTADVCLVSEGAYPYSVGGVSSWVQNLIAAHPDLTFHVLVVLPDREPRRMGYTLPPNVVGLHHVFLDRVGVPGNPGVRLNGALNGLREPLLALQQPHGGLDHLAAVIAVLARLPRSQRGQHALLDSKSAWNLTVGMYEAALPDGPFLDYFWACRCLLGGLYACLLGPLPKATIYHTVSTGYAGLVAARAKLEAGSRVLLTEHGIYTNERRIEITMADWVYGYPDPHLVVGDHEHGLADVWKDSFASYARVCYEASDHILTLYSGNQALQLRDGAPPEKLAIVPNGVDYEMYASIPAETGERPPTVALIGRVVAIKDVKTYIRACARLRRDVPGLKALVLGPMDEEPEYHAECLELVRRLDAGDTIVFTGRVDPKAYLGRIDCIVLTSVSEAQPLCLLEAGAAGVPCVASDVGACREMVLGRPDESPHLGCGGEITEPASPAATAKAMARLLGDDDYRRRCGRAIQERVRRYYNKQTIDRTYGDLYREMVMEA
ncbi:MAG: GT4 family glycosyltransferase PelF [Nitrospirae bacterium]|nr:GT4 family glycosyltransferase PelF [Nitrospirota bacterium]